MPLELAEQLDTALHILEQVDKGAPGQSSDACMGVMHVSCSMQCNV